MRTIKNSTRKSNVIVFFTDQQRWDTTGVHGNPLGLTPNFERIALEGTHLYHSFTPQPVCGPARACLQTGLYASTVGCHRNGIPLPRTSKTLAHYFKEAGYDTGYIGKWHLASGKLAVKPEERGGYDYWLGANVLEASSEPYNTIVYDNDCKPVKLPGYRVDAMTDAAIRYIDRHQENPFFLFVSYLEPHFQNHEDSFPAPDGYEEKYVSRWIPPDLMALNGTTHQHIAGYYGMVKKLDEALGRLLDTLKSLNMLDDTMILFTSDHGCHFKTRNGEYKRSCHESSIRIPTALCGSIFNGGGRVRELVSLVDLPPTLLDAAGISIPSSMQGRSILPLLRGDKSGWPEEVYIQISELQVGRAVRTQRWKYGVDAPGKSPKDCACSDVYEERYLYDLKADPYELVNLIGMYSHGEVKRIMRERLIRRMEENGEGRPEIIIAMEFPSKQRRVPEREMYM